MYGRAPYKGLLTHGFTVDSQGRKMSKSWATASTRRKPARSWAPRSSACGWRPATIRATSPATTRSWPAWWTPTAASATRCASCWPTSATSTRPKTPCRWTRCWRSTATRWAARRSCRPRSWRTTRCTSSTRWWPSCSCTAARTWALLPRHPQGPAVHHCPRLAGAAQRADRAVAHHARHAALDGAVPELHGRRSLEGVRHSESIFWRPTPSCLRPTTRCWPSGRASAKSATRSTRTSKPCARPARWARRCRPTVLGSPTPTARCWPAWATT
jgi:hypothetical protein